MDEANEKCPWCGSPISHDRFLQIQNQIREQEQQKLKEAEANMRRQMDADLEATKKAASQQYEEEAKKRIDQAEALETEARKKLQEANESVATLNKKHQEQLAREKESAARHGREEAQKAFAAQEAEYTKFREQFRQLQVSEAEARKQAQQAVDSKAALEKKHGQQLEAEKLAAERRAKQETDASHKKELVDQRAILEREHTVDLQRQKSDFQKQNEGALKKLQEAEHKYEELKTANQLGDLWERELYDVLKEHFPYDSITRVVKGHEGADIHHRVIYNGESCGLIVYDSKKRQRWLYDYVTKLHRDKVNAGAEHAILATTVFPAGQKEIWIDDSKVILVNPRQAVQIAHLLREWMVDMHRKGLGQTERALKTDKLYQFIASTEYKNQFDLVQNLTTELLEIDVNDKKAHDKVWRERGQLLIRQQHALREIETRVTAIVETSFAGQGSAA